MVYPPYYPGAAGNAKPPDSLIKVCLYGGMDKQAMRTIIDYRFCTGFYGWLRYNKYFTNMVPSF